MKNYILSIMLLASVSAFARPNEGKKIEKSNVATIETVTTLNAKQLQEENAQLKMQLVAMMNMQEELKGQLAYQQIMNNLFSKLNDQKNQDALEEMKAQVDYNRMMSNMFIRLHTTTK